MTRRLLSLLSLTLCGLLLNGLLLYWKLSDPAGGIAGCGGGSGCADVLASRWSQVFGIPIPVLGLLVYVLLFAALLGDFKRLQGLCFAAIVGSAGWLIVVQALLLHHFCTWCMAVHGVGGLLALLGGIFSQWDARFRHGLQAGAAAALGLALAQLYGPEPVTHRIDTAWNAPKSQPSGVHAEGSGRKISFDEGRKIYDVSSLPRLGSVDALRVMVEYFDFQCPACRKMAGYLAALVAKHPTDLCVLLLPVPLNHACNPALPITEAGHPASCELAKIALAVWRVKPDAYPELHRAFLSDPPLDQAAAMALAEAKVPAVQLASALRDPWIDRVIQTDIADWVAISGGKKILPQLLISDRKALHGLPSGEADFIRVMERELGL